jgi:hypothetical protein
MITLHEHGIQNENSAIRAHVGVISKRVYVFKTENARRAIDACKFEKRLAFQPGYSKPTADGWIAPIEAIEDIREINCAGWPLFEGFVPTLPTNEKGAKAVDIVLGLIERGLFPFWIKSSETKDKDIQIKGTDIIVDNKTSIQVKCDYKAGPKDINGCSGNLYLQSHEINPFGLF